MFFINAINVSFIHVVCLVACLALYAECQCMSNYVNCNGISSTSIQCDILSLNTEYAKRLLLICSTGSFTSLTIRITSGGYGATIDLALPQNITALNIDNPSSTSCSIETFESNLFLTRISFSGQTIRISQPNFFNNFINLRTIEATSTVINFEHLPTFTQNKELTFIRIYESTIQKESGRVITDGFILGLEKLTSLTWENGQITGIEPNAFTGVTNLGFMSLNNNQIRTLQDYSFEGLSSLTFLRLDNNNISTASDKAFSGLTRIRYIDLDRNPTFPLNTIAPLKSLVQVYIWYYNPEYLTPEPFQQLPELTLIEMYYIQFNCDCSKQWLSRLSNFGTSITITGSTCTEPPEFASGNPTDASIYTNCPSRSYPCFNHSIACSGEDWIRVDSGNTCNCTCKTGYRYSPELDSCSDANECQNDTMCEQTCVNTVGSYICGCMGGYLLKNGTYCQDVDECMAGNTNCTICTNTMGSYVCSCPDGYSLSGFSDCVEIDECQLSNGGCQQICINTEGGYNCACGSGYAVSADNLSYCQDVNECTLNNGDCQHACQNIEGGYFCSCSNGYELSPLNSSSCIDINECLVNNGNCHHNCHNIEGSYDCSCRENYSPSSSNINHCEADQEITTNQSRNETISPQVYIPIIIAIIFFILTLVLICILVVMCCAVSKHKKISADESKADTIIRGYTNPTDLRINIPKRITQNIEMREYEEMSPSKYSQGPISPSKNPIEKNGSSQYTQDPSDLNKRLPHEPTPPKREYEAMSPSHLSQPKVPEGEYAEVAAVYASIVEENRYYEL